MRHIEFNLENTNYISIKEGIVIEKTLKELDKRYTKGVSASIIDEGQIKRIVKAITKRDFKVTFKDEATHTKVYNVISEDGNNVANVFII